MVGGRLNRPSQALAMSTMGSESKCARWACGVCHFSITTNRRGMVTDAHRSILMHPVCWRDTTTYFDSTADKISGWVASKAIVTMVSSISLSLMAGTVAARLDAPVMVTRGGCHYGDGTRRR